MDRNWGSQYPSKMERKIKKESKRIKNPFFRPLLTLKEKERKKERKKWESQ